ncbi:MAG: hypothetical protein H6757_00380 [Candidatus Omnitrophica bacterium]|nr:hypothetical protein [Candidatus Omnitrophota bacterium]
MIEKKRLSDGDKPFIWSGLSVLPQSAKLFISLLLCVAGLCYLILLVSIWNDTGLRMSVITEAYADMDSIELVEHSFKYMFWFFGIFGLTGAIFLLSTVKEKIKIVFSVSVPLFIVLDIASAWLISKRAFFSGILGVSGFFLAGSFLVMFVFIQYDLWLKSRKES